MLIVNLEILRSSFKNTNMCIECVVMSDCLQSAASYFITAGFWVCMFVSRAEVMYAYTVCCVLVHCG